MDIKIFSLSCSVVLLKLRYIKKNPIKRGINILNILIINFNLKNIYIEFRTKAKLII